jgi:glycosyltransferase involved in cell wall biosynthesis
MRIIIVGETVSKKMAGEPLLPFLYFQKMHERNLDVWLVCHARTRDELRSNFPDKMFQRIYFIEDTFWPKFIFYIAQFFPWRGADFVFYELMRWQTQILARPLIRHLVKEFQLQLVFQPTPISPKMPSFLYGFGVPVVIGPMAGGMDFPPGFQYLEPKVSYLLVWLGRKVSARCNWLIPGKRLAAALIVSNDRTRDALPHDCRGKIYEVRDGAVDLSTLKLYPQTEPQLDQPIRFVFMARFVEQKGIRFLIEAFHIVAQQTNARLELIGSGNLLDEMKNRVTALGLQDQVHFHGWMRLEDAQKLLQQCDIFVVPSVGDPGNISMMEAMAAGVPLIATRWGGVGEIADETCAIMVEPTSPEGFTQALAEAMLKLAQSSEMRQCLGSGGRKRVKSHYLDWDSKVDRIIDIFAETLQEGRSQPMSQPPTLID